jgi:acyl-CoA synthetase (NDP forming)
VTLAAPEAPTVPALDFVFHPRAIAVAGASRREAMGFNGSMFVSALLEAGFDGPIFLIHPTVGALRGLKAYPRLTEIPDEVDYVISSVQAQFVPQLVEDCIAKGTVRVLHLFTAGFTETGHADRANMEQTVVARAVAAGIRVIGPNCMGLYAPSGRLAMATGQTMEAGPVAMLSQSGFNAQEVVRYGLPRGLRFSKVVSFGNGSDLKAADFFDYFADDPETRVITAYMEGIQDGPRLAGAIRRASATKPTVILKGGRTEAGSRAANSHTASLAGSSQVFDALCRQAGAIRVDSLEDLIDGAVAFQFIRHIAGPRIAFVGGGGGASVTGADALQAAGLELPDLLPDTAQQIAKITPIAGSSVSNPVDSSALFMDEAFEGTVRPCAEAANMDAIVFHMNFGGGAVARRYDVRKRQELIANTFGDLQRETGKPMVVAIRNPITPDSLEQTIQMQELLYHNGIASFASVERAARAIAMVLRRQKLLA